MGGIGPSGRMTTDPPSGTAAIRPYSLVVSEIGAAVDLSHPPERVWHALTDRELLAKWFTDAEPVTGVPGRLLLHTAGLSGFDAAVDAELTERREPELVELRCDEAGRRTQLTCAITPTDEGCRLAVREVLEHGTWAADQQALREECYQQVLTGRLPAILDWLAFQQVDLGGGEVGMTAEFPVAKAFGDQPAPVRPGRRPLLIAMLAGTVLVIGVAAWAVLPAEPEGAAGSRPVPLPTAATSPPLATPARPTAAATRTSVSPSRTSTPRSPRTSASNPQRARPLTARYQTVSTRLFGYTGEVVVDNPAGAVAKDWTVVVTLPEGSTLASASGADWRQDGQAVTFTGPPIPAGQSRTIRFDIRRAALHTSTPQGCTVGGNPCAGL
jgi:uncharacterized protein YndB with AHSA1/START domain